MQEDLAFQNLYVGYLNPGAILLVSTLTEYKRIFHIIDAYIFIFIHQDEFYSPFSQASPWKSIRKQIQQMEELTNAEERLVTRETAMFNIRAGNAVETWVFGVIETINGLILALEWNDLTNKRGGKKLKGIFRQRMFEAIKRGEGDGERFDGGRDVKIENGKFVRMHRKIVTSRNHTLRLYEMVSAITRSGMQTKIHSLVLRS